MRRLQDAIRFTKEPYVEDVGPRKIESIRFSTMSESEILKNAEVQVYKGFLYDKDRVPIEGGLLDSRMGPTSKYDTCSTCHGSWEQCPGHFGYMSLTLPVYNAAFLDTVIDILKCICKNCARTLLAEKDRLAYLKQMRNPKLDARKKKELFKMIAKKCTALASQGECSRCNYINGPVKKAVGEIGIIHNRNKIIDDSLDECKDAISRTKQSGSIITISSFVQPYTVYDLFKRMTDEDCEMLSVCERPEQLMIKNIAVPPIAIRPSVFVGGGMSNENDITERLKRIIQTNACLQQEILGASAAKNLTMLLDLQTEVAQYINSELRVPLHMQNARPLSGLVQRLKGKEGRIRGTLSGKRVEFTGRTVISPDPNLKVTEVGIPMLMARILTFPERVSHHNIEKLRQCVHNGRNIYPGAILIRWTDGTTGAVLDHLRTRFAGQLKIGDVVERHLENGDAILFNRQPSLHRMSIMCHRAKIMPWRTLRFNESVCNPYNADFDGDEMNIHVPQTEEARAEALTLMGVQSNLCIPKNGDMLVASTQDFLTSSFLITRKDTFYDRASFSLICCYMGDAMDPIDLPTPALLKPVELWTGKQLFSILLRPHANMRVYTNLSVIEKTYTKSRETMCPNDGFVCFHNSELVSGQLGKATLGNGNKNGLYCILLRDYNAHGAAVCINRLAKLSARWIGNHGFSIGIDDVQPGKRLNENKRKRISEGYECCDKLISDYNRGSPKQQPRSDSALALESEITKVLNTIRETAAKVCMEELDWRNSPLIMSQCGSKGSPINVSQMIACVGQQSVGGKRALNGFIDRSLPHFHRNSKTPDAKGFVANSFYSGLTATEFFFHTMGGREGLVDSAVKTASTGYMSRRLVKGLEDLSVHHDNTVRDASNSIVQFVYGDDGMDPAQMENKNGFPLNFDRLLSKAKAICPAGHSAGMSASEIFEAFSDKLSKFDTSPDGGCSQAFRHKLSEFLTKCSQISESKSVAQSISGITCRQLEVFLDTCISRYRVKKVDAGTAIGAIGAQSIGEPGTQMTLKTFHFAGVASMNVTLGVPRLEEIVNAAKKISTPIITTHLECFDNEKIARLVKVRIEKTYLGQVAKSIQLVMTARSASIIITLDFGVIQDAHLSIDSHTVRQSILKTPKIKLKEEHVKVLDGRKLEVTAPSTGTSKLHFELHRIKNKLLSVIVQGTSSAERVIINKMTNNKTKKENYELLVEGKGLLAVMGTEGVRASLTKSNDIIEVQNTLGIEAARAKIIDEMQNMMKAYDMSIDIRHFMLLADLMTCKGETKGLTRYGIVKDSVISNASFEKTVDHFSDASVQSRVDKIAGVSESIIVGMPVQLGTGMLQLRQRVPPVELTYNVDPIFA